MSKVIVPKRIQQKTISCESSDGSSKKSSCNHTVIHKVNMKGRNVNGNRPIRDKVTLVIKMDKKFKRDMAVLCKYLDIKSPTDVCRQLVSDMANQYRGLKGSGNKDNKKLTD